MASNPRQIMSAELFFFFHACPKYPSINHLNFYCIKQIGYVCPCVLYCNRSQKKSQRVKNNMQSRHSTLSRLVLFVLYTLLCHLWSITEYSTHTRENVIYLLMDIYVYISLIYAYIILVLHVRQPCNIFCLNVSLTFVFGCEKLYSGLTRGGSGQLGCWPGAHFEQSNENK